MKGYLCSQDGSYAFPLGPKVTTIGRENCDISINTAQLDNQHALIEYDNEQRSYVLKDLNSSTGTYVHDCRIQNTAVRLADKDILRFGFNSLLFEFRVEQIQETTMPSIHPRPSTSNSLHVINETIPSRKLTVGTTSNQQQIDVRQNSAFALRTSPLSAGAKSSPSLAPITNQNSNVVRESSIRPNAWTITSTGTGKNIINGSFTGELEISGQDNNEITNRVEQLEKDVKGRDVEVRHLTDRIRSLEPLNTTFANEVLILRTELDKVKREKQAASGLVSSLQRNLNSKESNIAKLTREIEGIKADGRDKDLRLQSMQGKINHLRDRSRVEEERSAKEKELRIKSAEQQITELNEIVIRIKTQLQDADKQILRLNQNEQKLKQECEITRKQLDNIQQSESTLKTNLADAQRKHNELCVNIWRCFSNDDNDEYDEDQHNIIEQIRQIQQQLNRSHNELERQYNEHKNSNEHLKNLFEKLLDTLTNSIQDQTTKTILSQARQQIIELEETADDDSLIGMFKRAAIHSIDNHIRLITDLHSLINKDNDQEQDLSVRETIAAIRFQFEEFEREKEKLLLEQISREQTFRSELEQITTEKDTFWQQHLNNECDRLREQIVQLQKDYDDQTCSYSDRIEQTLSQSNEYLQKWMILEKESTERINELTIQLNEYQRELTEEKEQQNQLLNTNEKQKDEFIQLEKQKNDIIEDLNGQMDVYKDQVRQFSITIMQLEKNLEDERTKSIQLQSDLDDLINNEQVNPTPRLPTVELLVPVLATPVVDHSQELLTYKSRIQEQEQIIVSLRRDLSGMTARLSDLQGELSEKQKHALEKSELTIREQTKELNETKSKLSKLSDIVDRQSAQIETLQTDLSKSKILANQYQLLVDQRQVDIERLKKSLQEKSLFAEQAEKTTQDEGRIAQEFVTIGAQCKGERHELTIARQREALNELRARIKTLEQLRPVNPSYERVLQQVVVLKRELAELRARQALPTDIPYFTTTSTTTATPLPGSNYVHQQSQRQSTGTIPQSLSATVQSEPTPELQKVIEERAAHSETLNSLQSSDELHNTFTRKLIKLLDIDDDSLLNVTSLAALPSGDRYVALQQRQRTTEILIQKIEMLRERITRKEELLRDYEKDLGKLRQAEILLREKDNLLHNIESDKRAKEDEALFLRNTLKETQDNLNQEKRISSSIKLGRNFVQPQTNDFIHRSGNSTTTLHHHCPPDTTSKVRTVKRDMNQKLARKDYEIKTLKKELHEALDTVSEQSNRVKLLELQRSRSISNENFGTNVLTTHNS